MTYSGLRSRMRALEVITNNLANLNSPGFKKSTAFFTVLKANSGEDLSPLAEATHNPQVLATTKTDFSAGTPFETGNPLDVALKGDGFFVVNTPEGQRYTRNGNFHLDSNRRLVTANGHPVLGGADLKNKGQPITLPEGDVQISESGQITVDGVISANLRIVSFNQPSELKVIGNSLYQAPNGLTEIPPDDPAVAQRFLEKSNVNVMTSIAEMISLMRSFEMMTQTARSFSKDIDQRLINEIGRV
jgi:flagellar basal-body rod protein FlgG